MTDIIPTIVSSAERFARSVFGGAVQRLHFVCPRTDGALPGFPPLMPGIPGSGPGYAASERVHG